ncbi:MAG: RNA polymerase sporulation sigma factor SigK [Fusicatenibacter sp.]|nr:RNA polymerase sporulation sigma factor SigK [Fusicatenibacter sp.]
METFQKPLTPQEEKAYLEAYKGGDEDAKRILIERNLRLVAHVVKKYQGLSEEMDDLISIGSIGLIKAVATFDYQKGNRLAAYAARCIDNELLMYLRAKKKTIREVSLYEPIGTDKEGNEIHLLDIIENGEEDTADRYTRKEDVRRLYAYYEHALGKQEKEVIRMRYGLFGGGEYTQRHIAEHLGISRSYVSRIEKNAVEKLRNCFAAVP